MTTLYDFPAPSLDDFAALAEAAWERLPDQFRESVGEVELRIADIADDETLDGMGIEDPYELTGLYLGVDLASRSVLDPQPRASEVWLYRRAILDEWSERGDVGLGELIEHVLVHEVGHHFGISDERIEEVEAAAD